MLKHQIIMQLDLRVIKGGLGIARVSYIFYVFTIMASVFRMKHAISRVLQSRQSHKFLFRSIDFILQKQALTASSVQVNSVNNRS